ncbi:uncharacterized protein N0V89_012428 [Didymosphaeria variabile]|uniref:Uncharacterized protein n=1 Tax=Didymosphaeria variabile TaxID=1932322 RepID=A0A9W9C503_9PLEO|nr:uncharacterized protein N0V89_012428 [Didymosphaeria variabile]KAJ4344684.1 hypothetical protein N0V89_012428 [Didymosphaeria variabile]
MDTDMYDEYGLERSYDDSEEDYDSCDAFDEDHYTYLALCMTETDEGGSEGNSSADTDLDQNLSWVAKKAYHLLINDSSASILSRAMFPDFESIYNKILQTELRLSPGLVEALQAESPPSHSQILSFHLDDFDGRNEFCVYMQVFQRDEEYILTIYCGSSTHIRGGSKRLLQYDSFLEDGTYASSMPKLIPQLAKDGWKRSAALVIAAIPIPDSNHDISYSKGLILLLETLFTTAFWFHCANTNGSITTFSLWDRSETLKIWKGACTGGSALKEAVEGRIGNPLTESYSPSLLAEMKEMRAKRARYRKAQKKANETPEETKARLEKDQIRKRNQREEVQMKETAEEKKERKAKHAAQFLHSKTILAASLTPEEIAERKKKKNESDRIGMAKKVASENTEQREKRLAMKRKSEAKGRARRKATETPEEKAERNRQERVRHAKRVAKKNAKSAAPPTNSA